MEFDFGSKEIRKSFRQKEEWTMINHGSYGLAPNEVLKQREMLLQEQEEQPDVWFRKTQKELYQLNCKKAADFLNCSQKDVFIVNNATYGTNCVLKSLKWKESDEILLTTHSYKSVVTTTEELCNLKGVTIRWVEIKFPIKDESEIIQSYEEAIEKYPNIKLAVIDHITSASALKMPAKDLISLMRKSNVLVHVDGAHAPGHIKIDLKELDPDFYVGNFHKWGYATRHCAFLFVNPSHEGAIHPVVTSNFARGNPWERYCYQGTTDCTSMFTLERSIDYLNELGGLEKVGKYTFDLLNQASEMLMKELSVAELEIPNSMKCLRMRVFKSPFHYKQLNLENADRLTEWFWDKYKVQMCFTEFNDQTYIRLSCNVYNNINDYKVAIIALKQVMKDVCSA